MARPNGSIRPATPTPVIVRNERLSTCVTPRKGPRGSSCRTRLETKAKPPATVLRGAAARQVTFGLYGRPEGAWIRRSVDWVGTGPRRCSRPCPVRPERGPAPPAAPKAKAHGVSGPGIQVACRHDRHSLAHAQLCASRARTFTHRARIFADDGLADRHAVMDFMARTGNGTPMSLRIIIADDHPIVRSGMRELLERSGEFGSSAPIARASAGVHVPAAPAAALDGWPLVSPSRCGTCSAAADPLE